MRQDRYLCILDCYLSHRIVSIMDYMCKGSTKTRNKRIKSKKTHKVMLSYTCWLTLQNAASRKMLENNLAKILTIDRFSLFLQQLIGIKA